MRGRTHIQVCSLAAHYSTLFITTLARTLLVAGDESTDLSSLSQKGTVLAHVTAADGGKMAPGTSGARVANNGVSPPSPALVFLLTLYISGFLQVVG